MSSTSEDEIPKRVTRKRTVKKTTTAPRKRTVKSTAKRTSRRTTKSNEVEEERFAPDIENTESPADQPRKAPTTFASERSNKKRKQRHMLVVSGVLVVGILASAGLGYMDPGVIDVDATIEARNQRLQSNSATLQDTERSTETIAVQNRGDDTKPDGGLVGLGIGTQTLPPAPPATTTASTTATTTDETASSTEAVIDDSTSSTEATREESAVLE